VCEPDPAEESAPLIAQDTDRVKNTCHLHRRGTDDLKVFRASSKSGEIEIMKTNALTPELRMKIDAYWRAANYLSSARFIFTTTPC
jgi:hypothetical protein